MTLEPKDRDLRELFQELRREDLQRTPAFQESMAEAREGAAASGPLSSRTSPAPAGSRVSRGPWRILAAPGTPLRLLWKGGLLAAAAVAALLLVRSPGTSEAEFERVVRTFSTDPATGAWKSPTDDLLKLPGLNLLSSVPSLGDKNWPGTPGPRPRRNQL